MNDAFDTAWNARFGGRHPAVEAELAALVDVHGASLADQPAQLRLLLTQACPDAGPQIEALVAAVEAGVIADLRAASDDPALPDILRAAVGQVQNRTLPDRDWAWWSVRTWAHAFALPTSGAATAPQPSSTGAPRAAFAPWMQDPADAPRATPPAATPPPAIAARAVEPVPAPPAPTPAIAQAPVAAVAPSPLPIARPPVDLEGRTRAWTDDARPQRTRRPALIVASIAVPLAALLIYLGWQWNATRFPAVPAAPTVVAAATPSPPAVATDVPAAEAPPSAPVDATPPTPTPAAGAVPADLPPPAADTPKPAPVASTPATIARIDVPRLVDGEPFAVTVRLAPGTHDVARVERRVTTASGNWPRTGTVDAFARTGAGDAWSIPFRAVAGPAQATVEFTAIARDGTRGAPRTVKLVVAATASASSAASAANGCAPATCGVVVEARELEPGASGGLPIYQLAVRNDAGETLSFTVPFRLSAGTRVRVNGGRLLPIVAAASR